MKDFILLFRGGLDYDTATPEQVQQSMLRWKNWMEELGKSGKSTGGQRLTGGGAVLKGENKQVTDGPYAEGKEAVGGFISLRASDLNEAIEISKGCPIFDHGGTTEVREVATS